MIQESLDFDGKTFARERDGARLGKQLRLVKEFLANGEWWTLRRLSDCSGYPEASVSARIRDLRKPKFGGYIIDTVFVERGLHRYRMRHAER